MNREYTITDWSSCIGTLPDHVIVVNFPSTKTIGMYGYADRTLDETLAFFGDKYVTAVFKNIRPKSILSQLKAVV